MLIFSAFALTFVSLKWINASQAYYYIMLVYLILEAFYPMNHKVDWSANPLSRACMVQILFIDKFAPQFLFITVYWIVQYLV